MSLSKKPTRYLGVRAVLPPDLQTATRAPTSADKAYVKGTLWLDTDAATAYMWPGTGNWISLGSGTTGAIVTLTGGSGGALSPTAGNMNLLGTANQITSTGAGSTITFSLPSAITAPGSLTTTTSLTVGNGLTVSAGTSSLKATTIVGTANINASGAGVTTIGTGGTGATHIGNATGNTDVTGTLTVSAGETITTGGLLVSGGDIINSHSDAGTDITIEVTNSNNADAASRAGVEIATGGASSGDPYLSFQISGVAASTMTVGLDNSASDLFVISNSTAVGTSNALTLTQAGALTATTTLTATLGNITATNGNLVLGTAGNKIVSSSVASTTTAGANSFGTVTLVGGTATVSTTAVTANSIIFLTRQSVGATGAAALGELSVGTITASTSFVINAWSQADATSLAATDVSSIGWMIVN